jgi:hypothetical protein
VIGTRLPIWDVRYTVVFAWKANVASTSVANTLLLDNALATVGADLPSAIAASLINSDRRVPAVCGDGGFMMNSQELEPAEHSIAPRARGRLGNRCGKLPRPCHRPSLGRRRHAKP